MTNLTKESIIDAGIEWYAYRDADGDLTREGCQCARCGSSAEFRPCCNCAGEGLSHHDCGEDCCACLEPEDNVVCDWCDGSGGSWHCISGPEWCEANPISGREHIKSTALRPEAWDD